MAEIIDGKVRSDPGGHATFRVRRDDGEEWDVDWTCTASAHAAAVAGANVQALRKMDNFGAALRVIESAEQGRGGGRVVIWFDAVAGGEMRHTYEYNQPPRLTAIEDGD